MVSQVIAFIVSMVAQHLFFWCEEFISSNRLVRAWFHAFVGSNCWLLTSPGLIGYIPHSLNPLMILTGVRDMDHASSTSAAITSEVITLPGWLMMYLWHASKRWFEQLQIHPLSLHLSKVVGAVPFFKVLLSSADKHHGRKSITRCRCTWENCVCLAVLCHCEHFKLVCACFPLTTAFASPWLLPYWHIHNSPNDDNAHKCFVEASVRLMGYVTSN